MVAHTYNTSTWGGRDKWIFEASLVYRLNFRLARATQRNLLCVCVEGILGGGLQKSGFRVNVGWKDFLLTHDEGLKHNKQNLLTDK